MDIRSTRDRLDDAVKHKRDLEEALLVLREIDPDVEAIADDCRTTKMHFISFIRRCQAHIKILEEAKVMTPVSAAPPPHPPPLTAAQKHKMKRVNSYEAQMIVDLDQVTNEINSLFTVVPTTDNAIKQTEERFSAYNKKAEMIIKDGTNLTNDAADLDMVVQAEALESSVRKVKSALLDGQSQLGEVKIRNQLYGTTSTFKATDIKPPTFSGDGDATSDYFTFRKEYSEFVDSRNYTKTQHLQILKKTNLTGTARLACAEMESTEEIFSYLKKTYGNPNILLDSKVKEFKKLGQCPTGPEKKRDWMIRVQQQLKYLIKLSTEHDILTDLYYSDVMQTIHTSMPYKAQTQFREAMEQLDLSSLTRQEVFTETVMFLDQEVSKATSNIKFNYLIGVDPSDKSKSVEKNKPAPKTPFPAKKTYSTAPQGGPASNQSPGPPTASAAQHPQVQPAPVYAAQAKFQPPKLVNCKLCTKKHEYLYYCEKYQKAMVKARYQMTVTMKACVRCLRMDSQLDPTRRWEWWLEHEPNCQTTWNCKVNDCVGKKPNFQYHFTMCTRHIQENKSRGADFTKALDQTLLKKETRFFFNENLNYLSNTSTPASQHKHGPGVIVQGVPNIPSIFLLQYVNTKEGKPLLTFFDTGCSTAVLSDAAYSILQTENVTKGPTKMGVAGGGVLEIPGGEERFWLNTTKKNVKAEFIGTHMPEITAAFPVYDLKEAFDDLLKHHRSVGNPRERLPRPPDKIGGSQVDLMIGIKYNKFYPKLNMTLPCGLAIYTSILKAPDGRQGVLGGPHQSWVHAQRSAQLLTASVFFTAELRALRSESETLRSHFKDLQHLEEEDEYTSHHGFQPLDLEESLIEKEERRIDEEERRKDEEDFFGLKETREVYLSASDTEYSCASCPLDLSNDEGKKDHFYPVLCPQPLHKDVMDPLTQPCKADHCRDHRSSHWTVPEHWKVDKNLLNLRTDIDRFENLEDVGTSLTYRCLRCRNCAACRKGEHLEKTSLEEEADQALIDTCVKFNPDRGMMEARLPFKVDPITNLINNRFQAEKMLRSQLRSIAKRPETKEDIFRAHNKLRDKGHVMAITDLPPDEMKAVLESLGAYWIPWSVVWKEASMSSPSRIVFNASMKTASGQSLNSILAKGTNKLPKILSLLIRFGSRKAAFSCDIAMAYNMVRLEPSYFTYQRYLWAEGLNPNDEAVDMVIRYLIYGVGPSGDLMTGGFHSTADYAEQEHKDQAQEGAEVLKDSTYVDDVLKSLDTVEDCIRVSISLNFVLNLAGMTTKGFTFSGSLPPDTVSADGASVGVLGYVWWPEEDLISLTQKDLTLGKSSRGRSAKPVTGDLRSALSVCFTRRVLSGKVCGIYDPRGLVTPISSRIKLCLSEIVDLKLDWDDKIPEKYLDVWVKNISDIQELSSLRFPRSFIHPEAVSDKMDLIVAMDASMNVAVVSIYARTLIPDGKYSCRLICAKSKLTHLSTVPRGELRAAVLGATLAHSVKQDIGERLNEIFYVTDSQIVMFWLHQDHRPLHTLVRNSVIEVRRLSKLENWYHVDSADNIADLGTRNCEIAEINSDSAWQNGLPWMCWPKKEMPIRTIADILLTQAEKKEASVEVKTPDVSGYVLSSLRTKVAERYEFSNYVVDPCGFPWPRAVRIMALVLKFAKLCSKPRLLRKKIAGKPPSKWIPDFAPSPVENPVSAPPFVENPVSAALSVENPVSAAPSPEIPISAAPPAECPISASPTAKNPIDSSLKQFLPECEAPMRLLSKLSSSAKVFVPNSSNPKNLEFFAKPYISDIEIPVDDRCKESDTSVASATGGEFRKLRLLSSQSADIEQKQRIFFNDECDHGDILGRAYVVRKINDPDILPRPPPTRTQLHLDENLLYFHLHSDEIKLAEEYFFTKATHEVLHFSKATDYKEVTELKDGILYYQGRILEGQEVDDIEQVMTDLHPLSFVRPVTDRWSPVSYSVMVHCHSNLVHHRTAAATVRESRNIIFVLRGHDLANEVREACTHCRRYKAKMLEVEMGNIHQSRLRIAAPFTTCQVDLFGPFDARCEHNHRATVKVWGLLFKCPASGALSAVALSKYDTGAFIQGYSRHAYRYGHPVHLYVDAGSQVLKACRDMELSYADIAHTLASEHDVGIQHTVAAVLGHNQIGMVERSVQEVKKLFNIVFVGLRLDSLSYETAFQFIANELNCLPLCLGTKYNNLDHTDLITPSRLILGRNNRRAPTGYTRISSRSRQVKDLDDVHRAWWKTWKLERLADYIPRPNKWLTTSREPEVGDIVVFLKCDKDVALGQSLWRLGRIVEVKVSADGAKRMLRIQYKHKKEKVFRDTWRTTRKIAIIHREGDLELIQELNSAAKIAAICIYARIINNWSCKSSFCATSCIDQERHSETVEIMKE